MRFQISSLSKTASAQIAHILQILRLGMHLHMSRKSLRSFKWFFASFTLKRSLFRMFYGMNFQRSRRIKIFTANITHEPSVVGHFMFFQTFRSEERFSARGAWKNLVAFIRVIFTFMRNQIAFVKIRPLAKFALIRFHSFVFVHVDLHFRRAIKSFPANFTCAFIISVVNFQMLMQYPFCSKRFWTKVALEIVFRVVGDPMSFHFVRTFEFFIANITGKRSRGRMADHMPRKRQFWLEIFVANQTLYRPETKIQMALVKKIC